MQHKKKIGTDNKLHVKKIQRLEKLVACTILLVINIYQMSQAINENKKAGGYKLHVKMQSR